MHGAREGRKLRGADAVVVRRDQHHARRAGGHSVRSQRHGVALCGRADLRQHRRARAGRDHGLEQHLTLDRRVQMELSRRAGDHQAVQSGVDEAGRQRRRGRDVDLLAGVVEREQGGVDPRRRHRHGGQDTVVV